MAGISRLFWGKEFCKKVCVCSVSACVWMYCVPVFSRNEAKIWQIFALGEIMTVNKHFSHANQLTVSFLSGIKRSAQLYGFPSSPSMARAMAPSGTRLGVWSSEGAERCHIVHPAPYSNEITCWNSYRDACSSPVLFTNFKNLGESKQSSISPDVTSQ